MKNVDRIKNQANIITEQKKKIDKNGTNIPKTFLVLIVLFVDKIFCHPSFPCSLTPLLMSQTLEYLLTSEYELTLICLLLQLHVPPLWFSLKSIISLFSMAFYRDLHIHDSFYL